MKPVMTFLHGAIPMVKQFQMIDGVIEQTSYPMISKVTSDTVEITSLSEMYKALTTHMKGQCMLKGILDRPLTNESRRQMCRPDTPTRIAVLDLDKAPFSHPDEFMKAIEMDDVSYIWQWSSSAKLTKAKTISGHIFVLLDKLMPPQHIKAWLMHLNLSKDILRKFITLSASKAALHWPLDIVVNDNGRIVYISPPIFKGLPDPIPPAERIVYVKKKEGMLPVARMKVPALETLKSEQRDLISVLREAEGLEKLRPKLKMVGEHEVQTGVGEVNSYEIIDTGGEFIRYNLNGGNSQAYWHPRYQPELLHSFKGEPSLLIKEVMPGRYAEMVRMSKQMDAAPDLQGEITIAFRDKVTAEYWKGVWNAKEHNLEIYTVSSKDQLHDFLASRNKPAPPFIPEWELVFEPHGKFIYDEKHKRINQFIETSLMRDKSVTGKFPLIQRIMDHAIGTGDIQGHFINWLATIIQQKRKTGTAWILHGTEGTGKGLLINRVLKPILERYLVVKKASELKSEFNGWMETALLVFIDEIEADVFERKSMEGDLRNAITEPTFSIRRMRVDSYERKSYANFIFSSNKKQPVRLPIGDRRFNVGRFQPEKLEITTKQVEEGIAKEVPAFASFLLNFEANADRAANVLHTEARAMIQALNMTAVDEFADDLLKGNLSKLFEYMPDERMMNEHNVQDVPAQAYAGMMRRFLFENQSNISRDQLVYLFQHAIGEIPAMRGANKFTSFLRHHGITTKKIWIDGNAVMGIQINWKMPDLKRAELQKSLIKSPSKIRRAK
jgi:hypothetical protein